MFIFKGIRDGAVVTALASQQCSLGSIPALFHMWWIECVVGSRLALRVFLWVLRYSRLHKNQHPNQIRPGWRARMPKPAAKANLLIFSWYWDRNLK